MLFFHPRENVHNALIVILTKFVVVKIMGHPDYAI